jgi:hypothetical protein
MADDPPDLHKRAAKLKREELTQAGAATPRLIQREKPPPPPWFTLVAGLVPAVPYSCFAPASNLLLWLPVYVACYYIFVRSRWNNLVCVLLCVGVTYRALSQMAWSFWARIAGSPILGFLMHLVESALWDTIEPFLIGQAGFGAGEQVWVNPPGASRGEERVTAASSVRAGDPRAAAASAFTQAELDVLAAHGIKPWDPEAQAALKRLETLHADGATAGADKKRTQVAGRPAGCG